MIKKESVLSTSKALGMPTMNPSEFPQASLALQLAFNYLFFSSNFGIQDNEKSNFLFNSIVFPCYFITSFKTCCFL
jgi:hypothetical protein